MITYFDCFSGISGDMTVGALIDLGLPLEKLTEDLATLPVGGYTLAVDREERHHIAGTRFSVRLDEKDHEHRTFGDIDRMLAASRLKPRVVDLARSIFLHLAEAEGKIHRKPIEKVAFHEVGAVDSIVDIVGTAIGVTLLGIDEVHASPLPAGKGFVTSMHGRLPVPAPATAELMRGMPVYGDEAAGELVTPTGAAILRTLCKTYGAMPAMVLDRVGYGVGRRERKDRPNLLRIFVGKPWPAAAYVSDRVWMIETNIDDLNPEIYEHLMERLFEKGAVDVALCPIQMKKNRPGVLLKVIGPEGLRDDLVRCIFSESSTIGVRYYPVDRRKLIRRDEKVTTRFGEVAVKVSESLDGEMFNVAPEYESCRKIAVEKGLPLKKVYEETLEAAAGTLSPFLGEALPPEDGNDL